MKPKSTLRFYLALASSSLLAISSASAITYTWTQTATGNQGWTTAGNWSGSTQFLSGTANELMFFADITTQLPAANNQTVISVPSTLEMNTLTLNGRGPNATTGFTVTIGTSASTWTIGDDTTSTVNLNSALGGGTSDRDVRYTIAANLELRGGTSGITTFMGNSGSGIGAVFSGNITQTGSNKGITKSGSSLLIFSGSNSYTGVTTVSAGTLRLNSANALSGGLGATGGTSALTISGNTGVVELGAGNFQRNLGAGSSEFQMTAGGINTSGFSAFGGPRVITVNNNVSQELVWGSGGFNPGKFLLNAATANDSLELTNKIDLSAATRTVVVNANKALISGDIRTASGTAGLTKEGAGTLILTGNNNYNGSTTITGGTLSVGAASNFGSGSSSLIIGAGTLQITGTTLTSISGLGHAVTFSNNLAKGFDIHNAANTFTVDQVLNQVTGTLTKSGVGTMVLNQNNTFTGATTATGGGTLVLDYSTNSGSKIGNAALNLNGTNLVLRGGGVFGQAVTSIVLAANTGNSISRDSSSATIANAGVLTAGGLSNLTIAEAGIVSTTTANTNGIQALGNVTVGSHFATKDAGNLLQAYSTYATATTAGGGAITVVNQLAGGGTMVGTLNSYALRIVNSGGSSNVLELGSNSLNMANGGTLLYAGSPGDNYTINGGSGQVKVNNGNQSLNMNIFDGTLTVNANIGVTGTGSLVKAGAGTLVVGGSQSSNIATYIQQGVFRLANASGLGSTAGGTIVQGGAALELSQTTALTPLDITVGAEALSINGTGISNEGALRNHSGTNTYGGLITIGVSGARINANAVSSLTLTGGIATTLTQDVTIGGAGNTTVSTTAISGSGNLIKDGAGTLTLSATNTYTGTTTVGGGAGSKLIVNGNISTSVLTTVQTGATLGGSGTVGALTINSGGIFSPGNSPGITTVNGNYIQNGTLQVEIEGGTAGNGNGFHDQVVVNGTVTLNSLLTLTTFTGTYAANNLLFILLNDGTDAISGTFTGLAQGASVGTYAGFDWQISYTGDSTGPAFTGGNDVVLLAVTAIPEPSAALLGALGLLMLLRRRRG